MFGNLFLSFGSFFFATLLLIIYFIKAKQTGINNKIFKLMVLLLIFEIMTEIIATTSIYYVNNDFWVNVLCRIHQAFSMAWILSVGLYGVTISKGYKIDNWFRYLLKDKAARPILIGSIIFISALPFTTYDNVVADGGAYMAGTGEYIQYVAGIFVIIMIVITVFKNKSELPDVNFTPLLIGVVAAIIQIILQLCFPVILITTECFVFSTYLLYLAFENPDLYLIKELELSKKKADDSNKTKTEFLSNMSHEIRTPINAIIGFSEGIINDDEMTKDEAVDDVSHIHAAGNSLLEIINNILDISKIENGEEYLENKEYDVSTMLMELKTIMDSRLIDKKIRFITNIDQNTPSKLYGDRTKLFQIFLNILSNASKYTEVGRITFTIKTDIVADDATLHIKIADTGYGIRQEDYDKLFEKFSRLDTTARKEIEGTGLGLLITKNLVNIMNGTIWFESQYGAGTTFYVDIPQKIVDKTPIGEMKFNTVLEKEEKHLDCTGFKVLLVDDNKLNLLVAEKVLLPYNFTVEKVQSGQECINNIKEGKEYDLIFMDIMMPDIDGEEVLRVLQKLDGYTIPPVVALTANAIAGAKEKYLADGFDGYLSKPISIKELDNTINRFFKDKVARKGIVEEIIFNPKEKEDVDTNNKLNVDYLVQNGIDIEEAKKNLVDIETVNEVLGFLYDDLDGLITNLEASMNDMAKYATIVHGLKSDCASLGIKELADKCLEHEEKSKANDLEFVKNDFVTLKELGIKYKSIIKNYLGR